jgi:DNA ligase-1
MPSFSSTPHHLVNAIEKPELIQPMLSAKFDPSMSIEEALESIDYPVIGMPKIDGYRGIIHPTKGLVTRKLLQWPNKHVWLKVQKHINRLICYDGELVVGTPFATGEGKKEVLRRSSPLMRENEDTPFTMYVFDNFEYPNVPYCDRLVELERGFQTDLPWLKFLEPALLESPAQALAYELEQLALGYEGIMLRDVSGTYKFGRSTLRQGHMIKVKRTVDDDAKIIGFKPRYRNDNPLETDEMGYAKRSSHKANLTPLEMLGAFICKSPNFEKPFNLGSGFDHAHAEQWWQNRDKLLGKWLTYKFIPHGTYEKPRHPIFLNFRED